MDTEKFEKKLVSSLNCGQIVFSTFTEDTGIPEDQAQLLASAFGGGMYSGDTCGAVVGGLLALGAVFGTHIPVNPSDMEKMQEKTLAFRERFKQKHGSCLCRDLLGVDCSTEEGMAIIEEKGLHQSICPHLMADAIEIVEDLIDEG
ncbi:MAG: C_GCAxxG_C_C family protein [Oscillospiraceae bacterium]|nr:C_GCAxxG_C_C family protein [Oscillospiraceae bacterium]MCR5174333.1 C-GCAxxG-C-C family protein [Oscillospiraceae bacterium]